VRELLKHGDGLSLSARRDRRTATMRSSAAGALVLRVRRHARHEKPSGRIIQEALEPMAFLALV